MQKLLFVALLILATVSCNKKKEDENIGPKNNLPLSHCFKSLFQISDRNIDLSIKADSFTASFPEEVVYKLILKGKSSGAVKSYSGSSDTLSEIWIGDSDNGTPFKGEEVEVRLEIPCQVVVNTIVIKPNKIYNCASIKSGLNASSITANLNNRPDTITASFSNEVVYSVAFEGKISGATKTYTGFADTIGILWKGESDNSRFFIAEEVNITLSFNCGNTSTKTISIQQPYDWSRDGVVISDFDGKGYVANAVMRPGYSSTGWSSYYTQPQSYISTLAITSTPLNAIQGNNYLAIKAQAGTDSWFGGGIYFNAPTSFPDTDPQNVFLNLFVNSGFNPTVLGLSFRDGSKMYNYILPSTWQGWKLVSVRLSDFKAITGESITNANTIVAFDISLNGLESKGETLEANLDYLILTKDKPLFE